MTDDKQHSGDTTRLVLDEELASLRARMQGQRASLVVISGWQIGKEFALSGTEWVIGRSPDVPISINLQSVSRQHARISRQTNKDGDYFEITDLGSMNGTHVNADLVKTSRINDGDKIQLGDVVVKFMLQDALESQFHQEVHQRIHYNQLTGLLTLESFKPHLLSEIQKTGPDKKFTLAMTDLDGLKKVNDTHGHLMGSRVIQEMGSIMRSVLRPADRAGLYGGDEAILLFAESPLTEAMKVAEQLRQAIAACTLEHNGKLVKVTISQGLAEFPTHGATIEQLIAAADGALYAAKGAGRNCVRVAEC
ncbi:MAG: GGDEF domain-containing protein [Candidatus Hydrogenedentes bacterium]|nr:GGDEF domain-containing protein [Candidatus Hydrogenedentota bacterium]